MRTGAKLLVMAGVAAIALTVVQLVRTTTNSRSSSSSSSSMDSPQLQSDAADSGIQNKKRQSAGVDSAPPGAGDRSLEAKGIKTWPPHMPIPQVTHSGPIRKRQHRRPSPFLAFGTPASPPSYQPNGAVTALPQRKPPRPSAPLHRRGKMKPPDADKRDFIVGLLY